MDAPASPANPSPATRLGLFLTPTAAAHADLIRQVQTALFPTLRRMTD